MKEELLQELSQVRAQQPEVTYAEAASTRQIVREEMQEQVPTREVIREEMYENELRQAKKNNIVILNLSETRLDQENADMTRINHLIQTKLNLDFVITNVKRMGTYNPERVRPIKITIERMEDKKLILSKATTLRELPEQDEFARVYIRPDLTKKQLTESKNLYAELKKIRDDQPEKRWKIFRGRIVEVTEERE